MLVNAKKRLTKLLPGILMHVYCYFIVLLAMMPQFFVAWQSFRKCQGGVFLEGYSLQSYAQALDKVLICRLTYTIRSSVAILQQIPMSIEEAAISLGCSKLKAFFIITVPMMTGGIMSGAIISWITIITELSTAIVLYSVKTETMTLTVYTSVVQGNDGVASAVATMLLAVTTISLLLFMKFSKNKDIAF